MKHRRSEFEDVVAELDRALAPYKAMRETREKYGVDGELDPALGHNKPVSAYMGSRLGEWMEVIDDYEDKE